MIHNSILDCIGNTPLVYLDRFADGAGARIAAKLEMFNPYSLKDRPVFYMMTEAEKRGDMNKDTTIIEASSGNTAIALAACCTIKGYKLIICMSEIQSLERRKVVQAMGAELELTPKEKGTAGARERAKQLAEEIPNSYYICQHSNPDNIFAHQETTAKEIWDDTGGQIDVLVTALGTTGTAQGAHRTIRPKRPGFKIIGIEPTQAPVLSQGIFNVHRMMGTAPGFVPEIYDPEAIDEFVLVSEEEAFEACRELARKEGIFAGITSGATALVSRRLAMTEEYRDKLIICIFADSGERYLSVEGLY